MTHDKQNCVSFLWHEYFISVHDMGIHREIHTSIMLHVIKIDRKCQELIVPGGLNF